MGGKPEVTSVLVAEHRLILRMLAVLERNAALTGAGSYRNYGFYLDAVDFIRNYADRFHHAKEEKILFEALVANGMPREHSPVAAMLLEHEHGRRFARALKEAARKAAAGATDQDGVIVANAFGYLQLLRDHIAKEDGVLYPLAERVLPASVRPAIVSAYAEAELGVAALAEKYDRMVERCEGEATGKAA